MSEKKGEVEPRKVEISVLETEKQIKNAVASGLTERLNNYSLVGWEYWVEENDAARRFLAVFRSLNTCNRKLREKVERQYGNDKTESVKNDDLAYEIAREEARRCLEIYRMVASTCLEPGETDSNKGDPLVELFNQVNEDAKKLETKDEQANKNILDLIRRTEGVFCDLIDFAEEEIIIPLIWPLMYEKPIFDFTQPGAVLSLWNLGGEK